jgi:hypothetical protein
MSEAEKRQEIEKEKSARQAAQAKVLEKERLGNEGAAIAAVSIGTQHQICYCKSSHLVFPILNTRRKPLMAPRLRLLKSKERIKRRLPS